MKIRISKCCNCKTIIVGKTLKQFQCLLCGKPCDTKLVDKKEFMQDILDKIK